MSKSFKFECDFDIGDKAWFIYQHEKAKYVKQAVITTITYIKHLYGDKIKDCISENSDEAESDCNLLYTIPFKTKEEAESFIKECDIN